ncbi:unnamed protein product [Mytilus edulis]|uniref:CCHC-type domain-containing protein n=1 Tax=Mytilus edulis TaxID=6550 RepID=A0A8S3RA55_MYTED|nr:unnamed protein product [Mytilus edulis]
MEVLKLPLQVREQLMKAENEIKDKYFNFVRSLSFCDLKKFDKVKYKDIMISELSTEMNGTVSIDILKSQCHCMSNALNNECQANGAKMAKKLLVNLETTYHRRKIPENNRLRDSLTRDKKQENECESTAKLNNHSCKKDDLRDKQRNSAENSKPHIGTLLVGSSVIRDITTDAFKLDDQPLCVQGGRVSDITAELLSKPVDEIACDENCLYIEHDDDFKLPNGAINSLLYNRDGVHLNKKGSVKLANSLDIFEKQVAKQVTRPSNARKSGGAPQRGYQRNNRQAARQSKPTATRNAQHVRYERHSQSENRRHNETNEDELSCWYCGEGNHISKNCRHGQYLQCKRCNEYGHKLKHCNL